MKTALLLLLAAFVSLAHGQSTQQETGTVEGRVLSISGEPLSKAALHLRASNGGTNYTVSTNGQGNFLFEGIKPGRYLLSADRSVVHDENGAVVPNATVSVWRPGAAQGELNAQLQVLANETGQFQFQNLLPGDYLVGAWQDLEPGLAQVPEFRSAFESSAVKVTLEENGHTNIDVKIFSASSVAAAMAKLP